MGGHFWAPYGLHTPRMPTKLYQAILRDVEQKLSGLFSRVQHAVAAPEKPDHGDLDVLVLPTTSSSTVPDIREIADLLGAERFEYVGTLLCFAIPWPTQPTDNSERAYAQLDLRICRSIQEFEWRLMLQAHGDLINIVLASIRQHGLTITDEALYARVPEIEKMSRKLSRVELTRNPSVTLSFLGLDPLRFFQPFSTREEMMDFAATCRFYSPGHYNESLAPEQSHDQQTTAETLTKWDQSKLKSRPMFRYWFEEYLPSHKGQQRGLSAHWTREQTLQDIFQFFGPEVEEYYNQHKKKALAQMNRTTLVPSLRSRLSNETQLSDSAIDQVIKAVKKSLTSTQHHREFPELKSMQEFFENGDLEAVITWAINNYAGILEFYHERNALSQQSDHSNSTQFSLSAPETYTAEDDMKIIGDENC